MSDHKAAAFAVPGDISAPTGGYRYDRHLLRALRGTGMEVSLVPLPGGFPFPSAAGMAEALAALEQVPPDRALLVDGLAFGALETAALDRLRAPVVALVHHPLADESGLSAHTARSLRAMERANLERAVHVLVPSPHTRDALASGYGVDPARVTVIRPGRPEPAPAQAPPEQDDPPLILSVGLLHPRKGHDILISALEQLVDLDWRAVIVGAPWAPGHDAALSRRIEAAGLAGRVRLAGRIGRAELDQLYQRACVFALATRHEGYGMVFDEALVHGLPIVSTTAGAVPGTVPRDAGVLVPPDDARSFATALRDLLADETARARRRSSRACR
ncbi:glycosyltransferase family 4 protein [Roseovarius sp. SYSU LYC5161]|uniref:glycosyltransferase family 4 protein n=1 Tax=Roseovarius halophilus (ex Wu et al. 2025) TaxID=3376060 RepID=UPI00399B85C3